MTDRRFLVLGGAGLVGYQVAARIATDLTPDQIVVASRTQAKVDRAVAGLREIAPEGVAIVGEFEKYGSKALADFIYECNQGRQTFFVGTREEAIARLMAAR